MNLKMRYSKNLKIILSVCLLSIVHSFAQDGIVDVYKKKYPNSHYVKLNKQIDVEVKLNGTEVLITESTGEEDFYITSASKNFSKESVSYSNFNTLKDVKASSYSLKKGKYVEHKVTDFKLKDELTTSFHDDIKSLNFIYSNLGKGSKTSLKTIYEIKNPRFVSSIYLGGGVPYENVTLNITVDNNVDIEFKKFHMDTLQVDYSVKRKKKKTIHHWSLKNVKPIKVFRNSPSYKNYFPHIIPVIKSIKTKGNEVKEISSNTNALYDWYYSLVCNVAKEKYDPNLVATVDELVKDKDSELEKVKAIYYWAQKNIKYVAFEYDLGGFVPRKPNDVYKKKYGDCKDNSMILYSMLEIAGIKSSLTWIGTRSIPYKYDEIPTPVTDNHMILTYENNGKKYFLDATGRYMTLGLPTSFIQGKEALLSHGKDNFEIAEVPVAEPEVNKSVDVATLRIEGSDMIGSGVRSIDGYLKIDEFHSLESITTDVDKLDYYRSFLSKGNNNFRVTNPVEKNLFSYDKPFEVSYDFKIPNYISAYEDELYVDLNLTPFFKRKIFTKDREVDFEADYKSYGECEYELTIPEGYEVKYIPENVEVKNKFFTSSISYQVVDNKIKYKHHVRLDYLVLKKKDFEFVFSEAKKIVKAYKELIVLKKK